MRILITADLHYDIPRSRAPARELAARACRQGGDALVLVGDSAGTELDPLRECLRLFADFDGLRLIVPGNHCLWCAGEETSLDRYERIIPELAAEEGFIVLDHAPQVLSGVGLAGSMGWYDYSLRDESLGVPLEFYREKIAPGAARYLGRCGDLLSRHAAELGERQMSIGARWMDGERIHLPMSDEAFTGRLVAALERQLAELTLRVGRIVAFVHHLPFAELVPPDRPDRFRFAAAFMGSVRIGQALLACGKVSDVYCGHSHWADRRRVGRLAVCNIGSTYVEKRLEVFEA